MSYFQSEGAQEQARDGVNVDFLLPTGILIPLPCKSSQKLEDIKENLWKKAKEFPLFGLLRNHEWYTLVFVNRKAEQEICHNEEKMLSDIRYYKPLFKVVEKKEDGEDKLFANRLSIIIDKSLKDFETVRDPEVNDFRLSMIDRCRHAVELRNQATWEEKVMYLYPPDVESSGEISSLVQDKLNPQNQFFVQVYALTQDRKEQRFLLPAQPRDTPKDLLDIALKRFNRAQGIEDHNPDDYILKVCGYEEYLLGDYPLVKYRCINRMIGKGSQPTLSLVSKASLKTDLPLEKFIAPNLARKEKTKSKESDVVSLWDIDGKLEIKVDSAGNLNVGKDTAIMVYAGVYHGDESLCTSGKTRTIQLEGGEGIWRWNENIVFDIDVRDIPRGARLCMAIYAVYGKPKTKKKGKAEPKGEKVPLAWVNLPLFDYRNYLQSGQVTLPCWPMSPEDTMEDLLNPVDTVMLNPNTQDSPSIKIKFKDYVPPPQCITFPELATVLEVASQEMAKYIHEQALPPMFRKQLLDIIQRGPMAQIDELEKELIWRFRMHLLETTPSSLPRLLSSVKWNQYKDVAVLQSILLAWRPLQPEDALELLDYAYQDPNVRAYAVRCLKALTDSELSQYLLQLCQTLKYESHFDCPLAQFLLDRAWKNRRIGHNVFWHLRSEMHTPQVSLRFGLILEAYLRGSPNHMTELNRQLDAMNKMRSMTELLQGRAYKDKDKGREAMRNLLSQKPYQDVMCNGITILNPKLRVGDLKVPECRFYDSKMRPLLLVYQNPDPSALLQDVHIIFKNGDDLRQDMLTLQIISIMDNIWQQEGLDLRLLPYGVLSTGNRVGFIEVVRKSETIANIQKLEKSNAKRIGLWDSQLLYLWLKKKNVTEPQFQKAAEAFCLSCAGYCVATYVLGIGDRHSDNIMITESGQLFHIDFGHFLGNFKVKFGVRRERVPFVLAHDFEIIIEKHFGFEKFVRLCEDAYLILRRHAGLFINMLAMMLQTGIPELRSIDDLNYVRDALVLEVSEKEAKEHFVHKLQDARRNAWSTSLNWYIHGLAKDNRA